MNDATTSRHVGTTVRGLAAVAVLVGGLVHLQLYFDGYRDFPNANLGRSFVLNGVASVVVAAVLLVRREMIVRLAGIGVLVGTLAAFLLSRTDRGIFGFTERGLEPSPQGVVALLAEIIGIVLLAATFLPAIGPGDDLAPAAALPAAAAVLVVGVVGSALWARTPEESTAVAPADSVPAPTSAAPSSAPPPTTAETPPATSATTTPTTDVKKGKGTGKDPGGTTTTAAPATQPPATDPPATQPPATEPPAAEAMTITIADFNFEPEMVEISAGTTVRWVNDDSFAHTVEANDGSFVSENMDEGATFEFTFTEAGTFDYVCGIHPSMTGTIVVN